MYMSQPVFSQGRVVSPVQNVGGTPTGRGASSTPGSPSLRSSPRNSGASSRRGSVTPPQDLDSQCIAFDITGAGDSWRRCPDMAVEGPVLNDGRKFKRYCDRHWQQLLASTGNNGVYILNPATDEPNQVDVCVDPDATNFDDNLFVNCKDRNQRFPLHVVFNADENTDNLIDKRAPSPKRQARASSPKPGTPVAQQRAQQALQASVLGQNVIPSVVGNIALYQGQVNDQRQNVTDGFVKRSPDFYDKGFPIRKLYEKEKSINKTFMVQDSLIQAPYNIPETYIPPDPRKRKFRNHLYEKNTAPPFMDFSRKELVDSLETIDTTKDYKEALEHIYYVKMMIGASKFNEKYNYEITEDVADQIAEMLGAYMYDMDRIELVLSYLFDYDSRDLTVDFRYFGFKPTSSGKKGKFKDDALVMLQELTKPIDTTVQVMVKPEASDGSGAPADTKSKSVTVPVKPRDINEEKEYLMRKYEARIDANMEALIKTARGSTGAVRAPGQTPPGQTLPGITLPGQTLPGQTLPGITPLPTGGVFAGLTQDVLLREQRNSFAKTNGLKCGVTEDEYNQLISILTAKNYTIDEAKNMINQKFIDLTKGKSGEFVGCTNIGDYRNVMNAKPTKTGAPPVAPAPATITVTGTVNDKTHIMFGDKKLDLKVGGPTGVNHVITDEEFNNFKGYFVKLANKYNTLPSQDKQVVYSGLQSGYNFGTTQGADRGYGLQLAAANSKTDLNFENIIKIDNKGTKTLDLPK